MKYQHALKLATGSCSKTEKCKADIIANFRDWGLSEEEIDDGIAFLIKEKFIDEHRYSMHFVHDKFRLNKWGKIKIAYMLRMKRIEDDLIKEALDSISGDDYEQTMRNILSIKIKSIKGANDRERKTKLAAFAQSRGFESEIAYKIASEVISSTSKHERTSQE